MFWMFKRLFWMFKRLFWMFKRLGQTLMSFRQVMRTRVSPKVMRTRKKVPTIFAQLSWYPHISYISGFLVIFLFWMSKYKYKYKYKYKRSLYSSVGIHIHPTFQLCKSFCCCCFECQNKNKNRPFTNIVLDI